MITTTASSPIVTGRPPDFLSLDLPSELSNRRPLPNYLTLPYLTLPYLTLPYLTFQVTLLPTLSSSVKSFYLPYLHINFHRTHTYYLLRLINTYLTWSGSFLYRTLLLYFNYFTFRSSRRSSEQKNNHPHPHPPPLLLPPPPKPRATKTETKNQTRTRQETLLDPNPHLTSSSSSSTYSSTTKVWFRFNYSTLLSISWSLPALVASRSCWR